MKKLIVFLITAAMLCVCMAGCGSTGNNAKDNNAPAQDATTTQSADTTTVQAADESTVQPAEGTTAQSDTDQTKDGETWENVFESWNEEAPALKTLVDYVENVTDESSKDFIPVEKRVAVFDMDGTIYAELFPTYFEYYMFAWRVLADPKFTPDQDMIQVAEDIKKGLCIQIDELFFTIVVNGFFQVFLRKNKVAVFISHQFLTKIPQNMFTIFHIWLRTILRDFSVVEQNH